MPAAANASVAPSSRSTMVNTSTTLPPASFASSASSKLKDYESALDAARVAATAGRMAMKAEGQAKEKELLEAAGAAAVATVQAAKAEIASQSATAKKALEAKVSGLASKAVARVLAA